MGMNLCTSVLACAITILLILGGPQVALLVGLAQVKAKVVETQRVGHMVVQLVHLGLALEVVAEMHQ